MVCSESKLTGMIGDHDVLASFADPRLDRERYRVAAQRGVYMAELIPRLECPFEKFEWRHIDTRFSVGRTRLSMVIPVALVPNSNILSLLHTAKSRGVQVAWSWKYVLLARC